jgi:hypothetical protein
LGEERIGEEEEIWRCGEEDMMSADASGGERVGAKNISPSSGMKRKLWLKEKDNNVH